MRRERGVGGGDLPEVGEQRAVLFGGGIAQLAHHPVEPLELGAHAGHLLGEGVVADIELAGAGGQGVAELVGCQVDHEVDRLLHVGRGRTTAWGRPHDGSGDAEEAEEDGGGDDECHVAQYPDEG